MAVVNTKLPPWGVILLHLGACAEAIQWAAKRPVSAATLRACPSREWRIWFAKHLGISTRSTWPNVVKAIQKALSGSGSGSGYGSGYGYGLDIVRA